MANKKSPNETRYDENVLKLLKQRVVLAYILRYTVKEFKGMEVKNIAKCIEGEPVIHEKRVDEYGQDIGDFMSPMIAGSDPNHKSSLDGTVLFDIVFNVFIPGRTGMIKMIVNVEAQNEVHKLGYHIVTRGIYYVARSISAQKNTEFTKSNYQNIKKVISIWICIGSDEEVKNTITEYSIEKKDLVGHYSREDYYDLISVVQVCLSKEIIEAAEDETKLLRLLETFLSTEISEEERKDIIVNEFDIPYSSEIERSVEEMCNASQGIKNEAMERGMIEGEIKGKVDIYYSEMNLSPLEISKKLGVEENKVKEIIAALPNSSK